MRFLLGLWKFRLAAPALAPALVLLIGAGAVRGAEPPDVEDGPVLRWITVSPVSASGEEIEVSILVTGSAQGSWVLETAVADRGWSNGVLPPVRREQVGDRVLTSFRFHTPGCGGRDLQIRMSRADGARCGSARIPFSPCGPGSRVIVPEWVPEPGGEPVWVPLALGQGAGGVVSLSVLSPAGDPLRTWSPMLLSQGAATVLWDGRADDGRAVPARDCRLRVERPEPEPDRGALGTNPTPAG